MIAQQPAQGALVDGRYQLVDRLGASARGESWRAQDKRFGQRPVVVRFMRDTELEGISLLEAEIARIPGLQSPHVAAVLDLGSGPSGRYQVREWVEGRSLNDWIDAQRVSGRAPEINAVRRIFEQISAGVAAVHALGGGRPVVHRAIKASNVILRIAPGAEPVAVLVDVATAAPSRQPAAVTAGSDPGSFYLAPEQWLGRPSEISPATDVFALAVLLVHMLTLRVANPNNDRWCVTASSFSAGLRDALSQMRIDVPSRLWDALALCLRPEAQQRPADASAMRAQLDPAWGAPLSQTPSGAPGSTQAVDMSSYLHSLGSGGPFVSAPLGGYANTPTVGPYRPMPNAPSPGSSSGAAGPLVAAALMVFFMLLSGGVFFFLRASPSQAPTPAILVPAPPPAFAQGPMVDSDIIPVGSSPVLGRSDALVTLVVFSDFQCPFCSRVEETLSEVRGEYGADLRTVWKNSPLAFHVNARPAAEAAMEAYTEGGSQAFWRFHDLAFQNQQNLGPASYELWAQQLGLDLTRFHYALETHSQAGVLSLDLALAQRLSVTGTPHFFINGTHLSGAQPLQRFREVITRVLARARSMTPRDQVYARMTANPVVMSPTPPRNPPEDPNRVYVIRPNVTAPYRGGRAAPVVIDHFSDFQCPFCARVNPTLVQLQAMYGERIRVVWRDYPLNFHPNAMLAAEAAHEVFLQRGNDAFWSFHDRVFANQRELSRANLELWATREGVNLARFRLALDGHIHQTAVRSDMEALTASGASIGTPVSFINGIRISGAQPLSAFQARIDAALARR